MRTAIFAAALLVGTAAIAQDYETTAPADTWTATTTTTTSLPVVVQPSNANPEHDARGIAVISDPAVVPAGFNGIADTGMGGPLVDPATGKTVVASDDSYPNCTAEITDNCLQAYERGRGSE